jgi:hypothetical protein
MKTTISLSILILFCSCFQRTYQEKSDNPITKLENLKLHKTSFGFDDKDDKIDSLYIHKSTLTGTVVKYKFKEPSFDDEPQWSLDLRIESNNNSKNVRAFFRWANLFDVEFCEQDIFELLHIYRTEYDACPSSSYTALYGISKDKLVLLHDNWDSANIDPYADIYTEKLSYVYFPVKTEKRVEFQRLDFSHNSDLIEDDNAVYFENPRFRESNMMIVHQTEIAYSNSNENYIDTLENKLKYYRFIDNGLSEVK